MIFISHQWLSKLHPDPRGRLVAQWYPLGFWSFFGSRLPYQVANPKTGVPLLQYGYWAAEVSR